MILKGQCWSRDLKKAIRSSAFSLLEVLVVTVMMTVILYGLYSMFNQTQKSFRANNAQVDVMNTARAAMDVIARDVELLAACNTANGANLMTLLSYPYDDPDGPAIKYNRSTPMIQTTVPGDSSGPFRTNFMQDFFFLQKQSNYWIPCGYFVGNTSLTSQGGVTNTVTQVDDSGVGSLYRIGFFTNEFGVEVSSTEYDANTAYFWMKKFRGKDAGGYRTDANLLAEGVVHFSVRCFDSQGQSIEYQNYYRPRETSWDRVYLDSSGIRRTNMPPQKSFNIYAPDMGLTMTSILDDYLVNYDEKKHEGFWRVDNKLLFPDNEVDAATNVVILGQALGTIGRMVVTDNLFLSNAIPSYVEIELGLLEPQAWDRLKAIGSDDVRRQYLMKNSGRVHLFRKRIPIRGAFQ